LANNNTQTKETFLASNTDKNNFIFSFGVKNNSISPQNANKINEKDNLFLFNKTNDNNLTLFNEPNKNVPQFESNNNVKNDNKTLFDKENIMNSKISSRKGNFQLFNEPKLFNDNNDVDDKKQINNNIITDKSKINTPFVIKEQNKSIKNNNNKIDRCLNEEKDKNKINFEELLTNNRSRDKENKRNVLG
jgi:hypothetical protein